jgi:hypothetical protein
MNDNAWQGLAFAFGVGLLMLFGWAWDLNKSEWAAWVQAVGSIGAIVGAIWISHRADRLKSQQAKAGALMFGHRLGMILHSQMEACANERDVDLRANAHVVRELVEIGRHIRLDGIAPEKINALIRLRTIAAVVLWASETALDRSYASFAHWRQEFANARDKVAEEMLQLGE